MDKSYLAAVDIGGTKITVSIADISGILVKVYQPVQLKGNDITVPGQVVSLVGFACGQAGINKDQIHAIGISTCGPFETNDTGLVLVAPNLCGGLIKARGIIPNDWTEVPLQRELSLIYDRIQIENDGISAVIAERMFGAGRGEDNVVYITWSTGIGSGAYVDGRLIKGKNGNAPHIGHVYLVDDGPVCGCGNSGDMEALVSGVAIARDYGSRARVKDVTAEHVFNMFYKGDQVAESVITKAARYFARGLVTINAILDTRMFIIGGSVFMNNIHTLLPLIRDEFCKSFPALSKNVKFRPSALDSYLGDLAGFCLVMPDDWVQQWLEKRPWESAPETIVLEPVIT